MARRLRRLAGVVAVGVMAVGGVSGCAGRSVPHGADRLVPTAARTAHPAAAPRVVAVPRLSQALAERGLLVVGASYTQGLGARPQTDGFAYQLGRALGWRTHVDGVAGTGFVNPGPHHEGTFADRIARERPGFDPGIVLIQGGRNDAGVPSSRLYAAVQRTVAVARDRFHADIAFLGPIPGALPVGGRQETVERVLAQAARADGVLFIDPIAEHWISPANLPRFAGPVKGHPNNAGYAYIADRLVVDLKAWGTRPV